MLQAKDALIFKAAGPDFVLVRIINLWKQWKVLIILKVVVKVSTSGGRESGKAGNGYANPDKPSVQ